MDRQQALQEYGVPAPYLYRGLIGRRRHYEPLSPGTLKGGRQRGLTKARNEANLSDSDARNYASYGASNTPGRRNKPGV